MDDLTDILLNRQAILAALVAISIFATILTFAMPLLADGSARTAHENRRLGARAHSRA